MELVISGGTLMVKSESSSSTCQMLLTAAVSIITKYYHCLLYQIYSPDLQVMITIDIM